MKYFGKYRCLFEAILDVEAESEEDAQKKATEILCTGLREDPGQIIAWPSDPPPTDPAP